MAQQRTKYKNMLRKLARDMTTLFYQGKKYCKKCLIMRMYELVGGPFL